MAGKGVKVGNAYIDVNYDVDMSSAIRQIEEFKVMADRLTNINAKINVDTKDANFGDAIKRQLVKVDSDVDTHSRGWGARMFSHISRSVGAAVTDMNDRFGRGFKDNDSFIRGFDAMLSILPGRMESLFSGKGGPIGLALGSGIMVGLAAMLPAIGAMISGALFAGLGAGAVAAGILLVAKDSRVVAAANRLKDMFKDKIFDGRGAEAFAKVTSAALDRITNALKGWAPIINSMLVGASKFVGPLTAGLIGFVDGFIRPLERVMNSPFMTQIMSTVSAGMSKLGQAFGAFFDKFINDSNATEGAVMGLNTMFNLLATAIRMAGDVLIFLSATWKRWNTDGQDGISVMDRIRGVLHNIGAAITLAGSLIMGILRPAWQLLWAALQPVLPVFQRIAEIVGGFLVMQFRAMGAILSEVTGWLREHEAVMRVVSFIVGVLVGALAAYVVVMMAVRIATLIWAAAQMILNVAMSPIFLIILAIIVVVALLVIAIMWVVKHLDFFKNLWNTVWGAVKSFFIDVWNAIVGYIQMYIQLVLLIITAVLEFIKGVWNAAWGWTKEVVTTIWNAIVAVVSFWINVIATVIQAVLTLILTVWNAGWNVVKDVVMFVWNAIVSGVQFWIGVVANVISTVLEFIKNVWNTAWGWVKETFINIFLTIGIFILQKMLQIKQFIQDAINLIKDIWNAGWGAVKDKAHEIWNNIEAKIHAAADAIANFVSSKLDALKNFWNEKWGAVKDKAHEIWNDIEAKIHAAADAIANFVRDKIENLKNNWNEVWGAVKNKAHEIWNDIEGKIKAVIDSIVNWVRTKIEEMKGGWQNIKEDIKRITHDAWNNINDKIHTAIGAISSIIHAVLDNVRNKWHDIFNNVREKAHEATNNINDKIHNVMGAINSIIHHVLDAINSKWTDIWNGMHRFLTELWGKIVNTVTTGINSVIDILNGGIRGINTVMEKVGVPFKIDPIPKLAQGGPVPGFAGGGKIRGRGTPTSDSVPILASRDEFMIRAKSAKRIGYKNLAYMNNTGLLPANSRFATGGRVGGGNNGLLEQHRDHVHVAMSVPPMGFPAIIAKAATSGFPYRVTSTFRPGSRGSGGGLDHHSTGRAVDFGGFNQDGFAGWWEKQAGVIELIHRTNSRDYAIFGGKGAGIGGIVGALINEFLGKGVGWVMDHMVGPAVDTLVNSIPRGTVYGEMARGTLIKLKDGLKAKIQAFIDSFAAMDSGGGGGGRGGAEKWRGVAEQALKMLNLPSSWLGPLLTLIGRESGGNPNAVNRTDSNAARGTPSMGLMQTIGPTFNAHKFPGHDNILAPLDNILAGLRYIQSRYGSIFNVQQAVGSTPRGYKNGGWTQRGWNFMHEPELALNSAQGRALEKRIAGDGFSINELHIHIGGPISEADARKAAETIRNELVKLGRRNGGKTGLPGS